jgi:DNA-binding transcriptional LysR family regulator
VFCDVVRLRSFSQAAQANGRSQSAVSQIVGGLEERLGVSLFNRAARPLQLTEVGKLYYEGCKGLVEQYLELEASIKERHDPIAATVEVAAIYSVFGDVRRAGELFRTHHPDAQIRVEYLHPDGVLEKVLGGTADIGVVSFPKPTKRLLVFPWRDEEMVLACAPSHVLARSAAVAPEQLQGQQYVGFDRKLPIRRAVDRFLNQHGVAVEVAAEFDNLENVKKAIEVSVGVALLPEPSLREEVASGRLVAIPLAGCRLVRPVGCVVRRQHKLSATASCFVETLCQSDNAIPPVDGNGTASERNGFHESPKVGKGRSQKKSE